MPKRLGDATTFGHSSRTNKISFARHSNIEQAPSQDLTVSEKTGELTFSLTFCPHVG